MASPPPVFAIIVGIDKYDASDNLGTLRGAVSDAESFRTYLTDSRSLGGLAVPHSHILFLANENATRSAILGAFDSHFLDNLDIPEHEDAAMIFYFAGHGSRVASPGNVLPVDGRVEVICPVDERTVGADGQYVHGIPDYLLGRVFREISRKKGPNITVILDSCHSGGMGRVEDVQRVARTASLPIPLDLDGHRWSDDSESTTTDYNVWTPADSHVLLAACTQNGIAYETPSEPFHGQFTNALISALRSTSLASTTYAELLARLPPMVEQTPHCGGANKDCALFTTSYSV
ncbi:peptidase C14, caspase domain-containing protein, partial [Roridomyces roridus]